MGSRSLVGSREFQAVISIPISNEVPNDLGRNAFTAVLKKSADLRFR